MLLYILLAVVGVQAMIETIPFSVTVDETSKVLWSFEFATPGTLDLTASLQEEPPGNSSLQLLLCSDAQLSKLTDVDITTICAHEVFDYFTPEKLIALRGTPEKLHMVVEKDGGLNLVAVNCLGQTWDGVLEVVAMNPDGEYLSMTQVPYKRVVSLIAVVFMVWNLFQMALWHQRSKTGLKNPYWLLVLSSFMSCVCAAVLMWCFILATKGIGIVKAKLERRETLLMIGLMVALMAATAVHEASGTLGLLALVPVYLIVCRVIFAATVTNSDMLQEQLSIVKNADVKALLPNIRTKIRIFETLQYTLLSLVLAEALLQLCIVIFWKSWVASVLHQAVLFLAVSNVCFGLRMRPFHPTAYHVDNGEQPEENSEDVRREEAPLIDRHSNNPIPWRPGKPYPATENDLAWLKCYDGPTFLIQAPSTKSGGTMVAACCLTGRKSAKPTSCCGGAE